MKSTPSRKFWLFAFIILTMSAVLVLAILPGQAAPSAGPVVSVPAVTIAGPNTVVSIPVTFTSNGNLISSIVFSIDYDQNYLKYEDQASTPYLFSLPPNFAGSCIPDTMDSSGELDCFIIYMTAPLQPLPDSVIATIKLRAGNPPGLVNAAVNFSTSSPNYSFGNTSGNSVPGSAVNGVVQINGVPGVEKADLVLDKTASSLQVWASTVFTYTMSVTNNGPNASGTLVLTDTLPAGVSFLGASGSGFNTCTIGLGGKITCTGNNLALNGIATLNMRVMAPPVAGIIVNKAGIHGTTSDPALSNNIDQVSVSVEPWADLAITNSCLPDSSDLLLLNCKMRASNLGPNVAFSVVMGNSWSGAVGPYQNISTVGGTCVPSGANLVCNYSGLAVGDSLEATFQVAASTVPLPCATASVISSTADINLANNTSKSCAGWTFLPVIAKEAVGPQPSISGYIKDASNNPVAGVTVNDGAGHSFVTDASGYYLIQNLAAGNYTVTPGKTCYSFAPTQRQVVLAANSVTDINFTATPNCSISGKVTRTGGVPLAGVTVSAGAGTDGVTDSSGNYTITGLPANNYTVTPSKACYNFSSAVVNVVGPVSGIDFTGTSTCSVAGVITKAGGGALAGVSVSDGAGHSTLTDANGTYTLSGLDGGSVIITPSRGCYTFNPTNRSLMVTGQHFGQDFTATPTCSISGKVTKLDGTAYAGVSVSNGTSTIVTAVDGTYTFSGLGDGSYTVTPSLANTSFNPPSRQVVLPPNAASINFTVSSSGGCAGYLGNGTFETDSYWEFPATPWKAGYYTGAQVKSGLRSLRTGILSVNDRVDSYSSGRQLVTIPADAKAATLFFWMYPQSGEPPLTMAQRVVLALTPESTEVGDFQYLVIDDASGNYLETLMTVRQNDQVWLYKSFDLLKYKGQTIMISFGTYNDNWNGVTSMFIDEVSLEVCR